MIDYRVVESVENAMTYSMSSVADALAKAVGMNEEASIRTLKRLKNFADAGVIATKQEFTPGGKPYRVLSPDEACVAVLFSQMADAGIFNSEVFKSEAMRRGLMPPPSGVLVTRNEGGRQIETPYWGNDPYEPKATLVPDRHLMQVLPRIWSGETWSFVVLLTFTGGGGLGHRSWLAPSDKFDLPTEQDQAWRDLYASQGITEFSKTTIALTATLRPFMQVLQETTQTFPWAGRV